MTKKCWKNKIFEKVTADTGLSDSDVMILKKTKGQNHKREGGGGGWAGESRVANFHRQNFEKRKIRLQISGKERACKNQDLHY